MAHYDVQEDTFKLGQPACCGSTRSQLIPSCCGDRHVLPPLAYRCQTSVAAVVRTRSFAAFLAARTLIFVSRWTTERVWFGVRSLLGRTISQTRIDAPGAFRRLEAALHHQQHRHRRSNFCCDPTANHLALPSKIARTYANPRSRAIATLSYPSQLTSCGDAPRATSSRTAATRRSDTAKGNAVFPQGSLRMSTFTPADRSLLSA